MERLFKRLLTVVIICGSALVVCQLILVFIANILSLDDLLTTTATSLLSSTNHEIVHNIDTELDRMMSLGDRVATDDEFRTYDRTETTLSITDRAAIEHTLGDDLSKMYSAGTYSDCCIIYSDSSYLGILDSETADTFGDTIYSFFSGAADSSTAAFHFTTGYEVNYSHLYYATRINSNSVFIISMLRDAFDTLFYDAEDNSSLTLRLVSAYDGILYSSDSTDEIGASLDPELSQAVSSSDHLSMVLRGNVIASDICDNQWRVISTIPTDDLKGSNTSLMNAYVVISVTIIIIGLICVILLIISIKRTMLRFKLIEDNLESYTNLEDINID